MDTSPQETKNYAMLVITEDIKDFIALNEI
jgi:hypothetical protein